MSAWIVDQVRNDEHPLVLSLSKDSQATTNIRLMS